MSKEKQETSEILISRMYAGDYLTEVNNVGHEVINMFKADNDKHYIYIAPYGDYAASHFSKNDDSNKIKVVLLVRAISDDDTYEVLAKAEKLTSVFEQCFGSRQYHRNKECVKKVHDAQLEYIKKNEVYYGHKRLDLVFADNIHNKGKDNDSSLYITFLAEEFRTPKNKLYITSNKSLENGINIFYINPKRSEKQGDNPKDINSKIIGQDSRAYFCNGSNGGSAGYDELEKLLNDVTLWNDKDSSKKVSDCEPNNYDRKFNFFELIHQENYELAFSNAIAYYLSIYPQMAKDFCKDVLDVELRDDYKIYREKDNIDILIEDDSQVIIIENKIKSNLNHVRYDEEDTNKIVGTQLDKYYKKAMDNEYNRQNKELSSLDRERKIKCFIFTPNYSNISQTLPQNKFSFDCKIKEVKDKNNKSKLEYEINYYNSKDKQNEDETVKGDFYKDVTVNYVEKKYSKILDFFSKYSDNGDKYIKDFISALEKHSSNYDNNFCEEMQRRFFKKIQEAKEQQ